MKKHLTVFEHDRIEADGGAGPNCVPPSVFEWLEEQSLNDGGVLRKVLTPSRTGGRRAVKVGSYTGVLQCPGGFHVEILPKIGKNTDEPYARRTLLDMLRSAPGFQHLQANPANLAVSRMPLLEVFIGEFLSATELVAKRGLRSAYVARIDHVASLRGKLQMAGHLRANAFRRDRFLTEHDDFLVDRPENRLLHSALRVVGEATVLAEHQRLVRELLFIFGEVPFSGDVTQDLRRIRLERGADYYRNALDWARLILNRLSPSVGMGNREAPSLLFPMDALFEAHVERHVGWQLADGYRLKRQARNRYLVRHREQEWFLLQPDLLIREGEQNRAVLDAKWKLLDESRGNNQDKYDLSQGDFYQLYAYGQHYLDGQGDMVLVFPRTDLFTSTREVFLFPGAKGLRLWVVPFCLSSHRLLYPQDHPVAQFFRGDA